MVPIVRVIYKPFPLKTGPQQPFDPSSLIQSQAIRFHGDKCDVHVVSQFVRGIPQRRWEGHIYSHVGLLSVSTSSNFTFVIISTAVISENKNENA